MTHLDDADQAPATTLQATRRGHDTVQGMDGKIYRISATAQAERLQAVERLRRQGMSSRAIAQEIGVSQRTVMRDLERLDRQG